MQRFSNITILLTAFFAVAAHGADPAKGKSLYTKHCAACHGDKGQGVRGEYSDPLVGDRTLKSLTQYIDKQMPEDEPKDCSGQDAVEVAAYIYGAFYSQAAQIRNDPPQIEPARLTHRQYQQAVADLLASFRNPNGESSKHHLTLNYYKRRGPGGKPVQTETVTEVKLDLGNDPPHPAMAVEEKDKDKKDIGPEYSLRWSGSIYAPVTGDYQFTVITTNGMRLFVNDEDQPLIDVWVRSGNDQEHQGTVRLLGGRLYPLRLEAFKEKRETAVKVAMDWTPPHRAREPLPAYAMVENHTQPTFVITTAFPPDDTSRGYVRGASISQAWDEATTYAALEVAEQVIRDMRRLSGAKSGDGNAVEKVTAFAQTFTERAFRRPLTDEQKAFFVTRLFNDVPKNDPGALEAAIKRHVVLTLKSPRFLFREIATPDHDLYDVASRMSFAMWDSIPDAKLLEAAKAGRLKDRNEVVKELDRMSRDPRARAKVRTFFHAWLGLDHLHELAKNTDRFPEFSPAVISDLHTSLDLAIDEVVWSDASDYRRLMTDDTVFLNARLAEVYGAKLENNAGFQKVAMANQKRSGVMTHPLLMAGYAYDTTSSPIHRGVFVARNLLGRRLRPPQEAVTPESPDLHPGMSTRQVIAKQTAPKACAGCHEMINPLGFTFENFDALGRFREKEKGKTVDTSGGYMTLDGDLREFKSAPDLGRFLAESPEAHTAFVQRLFQHTIHQSIHAYGLDRHEKLTRAFVDGGFNIRRFLIEMIADAATIADGTEKDGGNS